MVCSLCTMASFQDGRIQRSALHGKPTPACSCRVDVRRIHAAITIPRPDHTTFSRRMTRCMADLHADAQRSACDSCRSVRRPGLWPGTQTEAVMCTDPELLIRLKIFPFQGNRTKRTKCTWVNAHQIRKHGRSHTSIAAWQKALYILHRFDSISTMLFVEYAVLCSKCPIWDAERCVHCLFVV